MDDKRIEDVLRESWKAEPPDEMRDRVLRAARQELSRADRPLARVLRWRPLLASLAVVIVLLTNIADQRVQTRLAALTDGHSRTITAPVNRDFLRQRREIADMLALTPADTPGGKQAKVDDTL
ncbi:MAG: hypothetical protein NTU88_16595 [Armatimonadetes bacterium]|nr:hypothetical protein [Armatimonadota bacterium]